MSEDGHHPRVAKILVALSLVLLLSSPVVLAATLNPAATSNTTFVSAASTVTNSGNDKQLNFDAGNTDPATAGCTKTAGSHTALCLGDDSSVIMGQLNLVDTFATGSLASGQQYEFDFEMSTSASNTNCSQVSCFALSLVFIAATTGGTLTFYYCQLSVSANPVCPGGTSTWNTGDSFVDGSTVTSGTAFSDSNVGFAMTDGVGGGTKTNGVVQLYVSRAYVLSQITATGSSVFAIFGYTFSSGTGCPGNQPLSGGLCTYSSTPSSPSGQSPSGTTGGTGTLGTALPEFPAGLLLLSLASVAAYCLARWCSRTGRSRPDARGLTFPPGALLLHVSRVRLVVQVLWAQHQHCVRQFVVFP
jgi:hypothetical protein